MKALYAEQAMLPEGWGKDVLVEYDDGGTITAVRCGEARAAADAAGGPVIPGMANVHSHAFQRAMAGLAERMGSPEDSFWTWRELMYSFLKQLTPEQVHAIASQLYCEMLKSGYTAVGEFHYLHNAPDGRPYPRRAETALAHLRAAMETGLAITLLPSLYAYANFDEAALEPSQKRFATTPEALLAIVADLREACGENPDARIGVAPHSLRAVSPSMLMELHDGISAIDPSAPIHIHLAEQVKEVNDCLSWCDQRPVDWLLTHLPVDSRWCLVHCTHVSIYEAEKLAASGAVAGLCPTTESNRGDGIFPLARYRERRGRFAIGGDSHVSLSPVEELRWLEYGQRLALRRRNVAATLDLPSVGFNLWSEAATGGAQALGRPMGRIAPGMRADFVVLDSEHVNLAGRSGDALLDSLIFAGNGCLVKHVMVGGRWIVRDGHHPEEDRLAANYKRVTKLLVR